MNYTVSIYVAAPGTKLADGTVSEVGHIWYEVSDGQKTNAFGFALTHDDNGMPFGKGKVNGHGSDTTFYTDYVYKRTLEVTPYQYDKMLAFGKEHERNTLSHTDNINSGYGGFSSDKYNGFTNACVDFTYIALKQADLVPKYISMKEGNLKPTQNIGLLDMIEVPYPNSPLNRVERHPYPKQSFIQQLFSENEVVSTPKITRNTEKPSTDDIFASIMSAHLSGDDKALKQAQVAAFNSDLAQNTYNEIRQQNIAMETQLAEQQRQVELEREQAITMQAPVKTMRM